MAHWAIFPVIVYGCGYADTDTDERNNPNVFQPVRLLRRYSTFQYSYEDWCPGGFNADALFHASVSVKSIFLFLPYF